MNWWIKVTVSRESWLTKTPRPVQLFCVFHAPQVNLAVPCQVLSNNKFHQIYSIVLMHMYSTVVYSQSGYYLSIFLKKVNINKRTLFKDRTLNLLKRTDLILVSFPGNVFSSRKASNRYTASVDSSSRLLITIQTQIFLLCLLQVILVKVPVE